MSICGHPVDDNSIAHVYDAVEIGGCFRVVGDHHDGLAKIFVQLPEHLEDDFCVLRMQLSGGLVAEKNLRRVDDCAGDSDALLLAAGKFRRFVMKAPCQAEHLRYNVEAMGIETSTVNKLCDGDVAFGCQRGEQIEALKDEADFVAPKFGARRIAQFGKVVPIDQHFTP